MAGPLHTFDAKSVEKLAATVRDQQREIQSLKRSLAHLAVRRHETAWKPGGGNPRLVEKASGTVAGSDKTTQALASTTFYEQELNGSLQVADTGITHTAYWLSSWEGIEASKGILCEDRNGAKFVVPIWGFISSPGSGTRVYRPHYIGNCAPVSATITNTPEEWDYSVSQDWGDVITIGTSGDAGRLILNRIGNYKFTHVLDITRTTGTGFDTIYLNFFALDDCYLSFNEANERQTITVSHYYFAAANDTKVYVSASCNSGFEYAVNSCVTWCEPLFD